MRADWEWPQSLDGKELAARLFVLFRFQNFFFSPWLTKSFATITPLCCPMRQASQLCVVYRPKLLPWSTPGVENESPSGEPLALNYWTRGEANHWDPAAGIGCKPIPRFDSWSLVDLHSQALRFLRAACAILAWPARSLNPFPRSKSHAIRIQGLLRFPGHLDFLSARFRTGSSFPFVNFRTISLRTLAWASFPPVQHSNRIVEREGPGIASASTVPPTRSLALDRRSRTQPPYKQASVAALGLLFSQGTVAGTCSITV